MLKERYRHCFFVIASAFIGDHSMRDGLKQKTLFMDPGHRYPKRAIVKADYQV